jgi:hypothetical protein
MAKVTDQDIIVVAQEITDGVLTPNNYHLEADQHAAAMYAIIVDEDIVDFRMYKKAFIDLYNNNTFVEKSFANGKYTIDVVDSNDEVVEELELSEAVGALFLSNPITIKATRENRIRPGMRYVNGILIRP